MIGRLKRARKPYARISKNVTVHDRGDHLALRLHNTDIIQFYPDGSMVLDSGGWRTVTTKRWMDDYLPPGLCIWSQKSVWYIGKGWGGGNKKLFQDGARIGPKGGLCIPKGPSQKKMAALKKKVDAYARKFVAEMLAGNIPAPGTGDCFFCQMQDADSGENLGDKVSSDHLLSHLDDEYFVPSLLVNALKEKGAFHGIYMWPLAKFWGKQAELGCPFYAMDSVEAVYVSAIRKYFYRRLGIAGNAAAVPKRKTA